MAIGSERPARHGASAARHRPRREVGAIHQLPWRQPRNPYRPIEVLNEEQLARIEDASFTLLETQGLEIMSEEALDILAGAGAAVDRSNGRVRFDRGLVREQIAKAPSRFTLHARNPAHDVEIGGDRIAFCAVSLSSLSVRVTLVEAVSPAVLIWRAISPLLSSIVRVKAKPFSLIDASA